MKLDIKGFLKCSMVDWDGKNTAVIFLGQCNLRCPFCHNGDVINPSARESKDTNEIFRYLEREKGWLDGVVISGGEPTIYDYDLYALCHRLKKIGHKVKVDTNGTNPDVIAGLMLANVVDYIALDIKAPLWKYKFFSKPSYGEKVLQTIRILKHQNAYDYEFRTTMVPELISKQDFVEICKVLIKGAKRYAIQQFDNRNPTLNPSYQTVTPWTKIDLQNFAKTAKAKLPGTEIIERW